jgi:hypothetical protein
MIVIIQILHELQNFKTENFSSSHVKGIDVIHFNDVILSKYFQNIINPYKSIRVFYIHLIILSH